MVMMRRMPVRPVALRRPVAVAAGKVGEDGGVGAVFESGQIELVGGHVDRRGFEAEVDADGGLRDHGRKQMLPRVLLHEVKTAGPVDFAVDRYGGEGSAEQMGDAPVLLVDHIVDRDAVEGAEVVELAAGGGIEGRLVQVDPAALFRRGGDARLKRRGVGVVVVQAHSGYWMARLTRLLTWAPKLR
jgi:hypothetical protein